jgi:hypothetical protein
MGCTLYELVAGTPLFMHDNEFQAYLPITNFDTNGLDYMIGNGKEKENENEKEKENEKENGNGNKNKIINGNDEHISDKMKGTKCNFLTGLNVYTTHNQNVIKDLIKEMFEPSFNAKNVGRMKGGKKSTNYGPNNVCNTTLYNAKVCESCYATTDELILDECDSNMLDCIVEKHCFDNLLMKKLPATEAKQMISDIKKEKEIKHEKAETKTGGMKTTPKSVPKRNPLTRHVNMQLLNGGKLRTKPQLKAFVKKLYADNPTIVEKVMAYSKARGLTLI